MPPNFLDTVFAGEQHHLLQQLVLMTMRFNNWGSGAATPTNYMRTSHNIGFSPSLLAFTGPFHMVIFSSLHLSTSHSLWLEHNPPGVQKSRSDTILKLLFAITNGKHRSLLLLISWLHFFSVIQGGLSECSQICHKVSLSKKMITRFNKFHVINWFKSLTG